MCSSPIGSGGGASINDFSALLGDVGSTQGIGSTGVGSLGPQTAPPVDTKDTVEFRSQIQASQVNAYDTPANQPLLSPTVVMPQTAAPPPSNIGDLQQTQFVQLVDQLPPGLRVQLLKDMALPADQRNPQLAGLEATLQKGAAVTVWEQQVLQGQAQMNQVPLELKADVQQKIQQNADPTAQVQALLSKPKLTPQDAQMLKALSQMPGIVTPEQLGTINAKLIQEGYNPVTPSPPPGVQGSAYLSPVNGTMPSTIDPTTMPTADMTQQMGINGVQVLNNQLAVAIAHVNAMPPGAAKESLMDYLKFVTETISKVQQLLGEISSADAMRGSKQIMGQKAVMEAKMQKAMEQLKAQREQQAKAKMIGTIMKVVGIVVAVVCLVLAVFTGGATAVALAAIMLAITVLASTTHIVDDFMKTLMGMVMKVMKSMGLPEDVCKVLMMLLIILVTIALAVVTKGAVMEEGASMAAEAAQVEARAAVTATSEAAQTAASSAQTAASSAEAAASSAQTAASTAQTAASTAQTASSTAQTAASTAQTAASTAQTASSTAQTAASTAQTASSSAQTASGAGQSASGAGQSGAQSASTAAQTAEAAAEAPKASSLTKVVAEMESGQAAGLVLNHSNNAIQQGLMPILKKMGMDDKTAELISQLLQMLVQLAVGLVAAGGLAGMSRAGEAMAETGQTAASNAVKMVEKLQTAVQVITDAIAAITQLQMAELSKKIGAAKAEGIELNALLDMYKKDREFRDKSTKSIDELVTSYNQFFTNVLNSMDKILSQTFA